MKPLYIFDLDGTLALIEHRKHIIEEPGKDDSKWRRFYAACDEDLPNESVIRVFSALIRSGAECMIFTGRSDEVWEKTSNWLMEHVPGSVPMLVKMRESGDHTADDVLKLKWYRELPDVDKSRLVAVFEDRARVVEMWRSLGVACFQVAPGEF